MTADTAVLRSLASQEPAVNRVKNSVVLESRVRHDNPQSDDEVDATCHEKSKLQLSVSIPPPSPSTMNSLTKKTGSLPCTPTTLDCSMSTTTSSMSAVPSDAFATPPSSSQQRTTSVSVPSIRRPQLDPTYAQRMGLPKDIHVNTDGSFLGDPLSSFPRRHSILRSYANDSVSPIPSPITSTQPRFPESSGSSFFSEDARHDEYSESAAHIPGRVRARSSLSMPSYGKSLLDRDQYWSRSTLLRNDINSDRFIPSRSTSISSAAASTSLWNARNDRRARQQPRTSNNTGISNSSNRSNRSNINNMNVRANQPSHSDNDNQDAQSSGAPNSSSFPPPTGANNLHHALLRSELLGENSGRTSRPIFRYNNSHPHGDENADVYSPSSASTPYDSIAHSFGLSPLHCAASRRLIAAPMKRKRRIAKVPFKVLDAPALQDDFYLNLVDWSSQNVLAVGLGACVYLWSACTSKVTKLCDLSAAGSDGEAGDIITSVSWAPRGVHLAVGTGRGGVQLWDAVRGAKIRTLPGHAARVGTVAWGSGDGALASGSRDRLILVRDVRVAAAYTDRWNGHTQEVCGLKWSRDDPASVLASGGNDNQLLVQDRRYSSNGNGALGTRLNNCPIVHRFTDHTAAVKAIAWSPHQHGLLASGGGTADRCIRFWNTLGSSNSNSGGANNPSGSNSTTNTASLSCVDTGSQVCNLAWSRNCNEIVSTHGYSLNQIVVWRYNGNAASSISSSSPQSSESPSSTSSLSKVITLTGHTYRVLYLAMSPDGSTIVTGAGDETLRFWQVFPGSGSAAGRTSSAGAGSGQLFPPTLGSTIR